MRFGRWASERRKMQNCVHDLRPFHGVQCNAVWEHERAFNFSALDGSCTTGPDLAPVPRLHR